MKVKKFNCGKILVHVRVHIYTVLLYDVKYASSIVHFYQTSGNRAPQNLMTTVPEKVWPDAKVPYKFDPAISELNITGSITNISYSQWPLYSYIEHVSDTFLVKQLFLSMKW